MVFQKPMRRKACLAMKKGIFWLLKESLAKPEKDTTYSYKVWLNGELYEQEKTVSLTEDGKLLKWYYKKNIEKPNTDASDYYLISFEAFKQPKGGEKEALGIFCGKISSWEKKSQDRRIVFTCEEDLFHEKRSFSEKNSKKRLLSKKAFLYK